MWRMTPWETTPTTSRAAMIAMQQAIWSVKPVCAGFCTAEGVADSDKVLTLLFPAISGIRAGARECGWVAGFGYVVPGYGRHRLRPRGQAWLQPLPARQY